MEMSFSFTCDICQFYIVDDSKFTIESTEWESEAEGCGGGVDEDNVCANCHSQIKNYIQKIKSLDY